MSLAANPYSSFALALGTLLGPAIEARFSRALGRMSGGQLTGGRSQSSPAAPAR